MASTRVLIILMGSLGDVARALCVAHALKRAAPEVHITWLIENANRALVEGHPDIDAVIVFRRGAFVRSFVSAVRQMRALRIDVVLDLQRILKSGVFSFASGAKRRIGFSPANSKEFNWIFNTETVPFVDESKVSKVLHYLEFVKALGLPVGPVKFGLDFMIRDYSGKYADFPPSYLVLVLASRWDTKNWELAGFRELIDRLLTSSSMRVILLGDKSCDASAKQLESQLNSARIVNLVSRTTLVDLAWILSRAAVCVGPDSGPGHMAAALGVPYITLFGPTAIARVAPWSFEKLAISANASCSPCGLRKCPGFDKLCMRMISADTVFRAIQEGGY